MLQYSKMSKRAQKIIAQSAMGASFSDCSTFSASVHEKEYDMFKTDAQIVILHQLFVKIKTALPKKQE